MPSTIAYAATTQGITVTVRPVYLDAQSSFFEKRFVFAYAVRIENRRLEDVQVLRRHWTIEEAIGAVQDAEVEGVPGGAQPVIAPGAAHEYRALCATGSFDAEVHGSVLMQRAGGQRFRATLPRFYLHAAAN